jgi:hypothetical protein
MLEHADDLDVPRFFATNKCLSHAYESPLVYRDMHRWDLTRPSQARSVNEHD